MSPKIVLTALKQKRYHQDLFPGPDIVPQVPGLIEEGDVSAVRQLLSVFEPLSSLFDPASLFSEIAHISFLAKFRCVSNIAWQWRLFLQGTRSLPSLHPSPLSPVEDCSFFAETRPLFPRSSHCLDPPVPELVQTSKGYRVHWADHLPWNDEPQLFWYHRYS